MSATDTHSPLPGQPLLADLDGLLPALQGYPVTDLVSVYTEMAAQAPASMDAARSFVLVERCISNWIETLELTLASSQPCDEEPHKRLRQRQQGARDALLNVRRMLSAAESRRRWGPPAAALLNQPLCSRNSPASALMCSACWFIDCAAAADCSTRAAFC
ncbi:hypothetical protein PEC18_31375 [Paucibacter sp. O1-1]|nr:hypothetical protein [Paucibacter sp. O1-1]MDA3830206.1 hypothetical protein [Paucibacter sp. O1-1]